MKQTDRVALVTYDRAKSQLGVTLPAGHVTASLGAGMQIRDFVKELRDLSDCLEDLCKQS
jgi:hypothetical protein